MKGLEKARHSRSGGCHPRMYGLLGAMAALFLVAAVPARGAEQLEEAFLRIEINATDGDVGLHGKFDGGPWKLMSIESPNGSEIYHVDANGALRDQGLTENFFESDEPTCAEQPLRDFLERFPTGTYQFTGTTLDDKDLTGKWKLSHALPAAPDITQTDGLEFDVDAVVIAWDPGMGLGNCDDPTLVTDGIIPDPADVTVQTWEVTVEPVLQGQGQPLRVFTVQLPFDQQRVTVPSEYLQAYVDAGITAFKFEVGAKAGENQTFSEGNFTISK